MKALIILILISQPAFARGGHSHCGSRHYTVGSYYANPRIVHIPVVKKGHK